MTEDSFSVHKLEKRRTFKRRTFLKTNFLKGVVLPILVFLCIYCKALLLLPDPFRGMGACRKTMKPQKPGNSPGPGSEVVEGQRVVKKRAAQRVRSWTVQNEMRDVLGRLSTGAARRILDSANFGELRA